MNHTIEVMKLQQVELRYGSRKILSELNTEIKPWEFIFLIGSSGSGKTSFIRTLVGELEPTSGIILDDEGRNLYQLKSRELSQYRRKIWVVFQDFKLLETKTVKENVVFAMEVSGYPDSVIQKRLPEVLTEVGLLSKKEALVQTLSGGEAQRIWIARALIHNPDIIIGDEPTGNLDPDNAWEIMAIFERLHQEWKTIIVSTHDSLLVNSMKKRVIEFSWGNIIRDETPGKYQN
jgi:cell division transport system ATP-binding protein